MTAVTTTSGAKSREAFTRLLRAETEKVRSDEEYIDVVRNNGGVELLMHILREYPKEKEIQFNGMALLRAAANVDSQIGLCVGGVSIALAALTNFPRSPSITSIAFYLLVVLMRHDNCLEEAAKISLAPTLIAILGDNKQDKKTLSMGCEVIGRMVLNGRVATMVARSQGVAAVVTAMKSAEDYASLQRQGCFALSAFASFDQLATAIIDDGGVDVIITAMKLHIGEVEVQRNGIRTFGKLMWRARNPHYIAAAGGKEVVLAAAAAHPGDTNLCLDADALLEDWHDPVLLPSLIVFGFLGVLAYGAYRAYRAGWTVWAEPTPIDHFSR